MEKKDLLKDVIKHIDIKSYNSTELVDAMRNMSFTSRDTARAADILMMMCKEKECTNILTLAGSTCTFTMTFLFRSTVLCSL